MTIDVEHYRDHLEKVLANLGEGEWILWTKDSVEGWAESVNLPQRGAFIPAMAVRASDGRRILVIRRLLTDDIRNGVLGGFLIRGRGEQKELEEPLPFLEHLVLHEVAHHVLDTKDEDACDAWALEKMAARRGNA